MSNSDGNVFEAIRAAEVEDNVERVRGHRSVLAREVTRLMGLNADLEAHATRADNLTKERDGYMGVLRRIATRLKCGQSEEVVMDAIEKLESKASDLETKVESIRADANQAQSAYDAEYARFNADRARIVGALGMTESTHTDDVVALISRLVRADAGIGKVVDVEEIATDAVERFKQDCSPEIRMSNSWGKLRSMVEEAIREALR